MLLIGYPLVKVLKVLMDAAGRDSVKRPLLNRRVLWDEAEDKLEIGRLRSD